MTAFLTIFRRFRKILENVAEQWLKQWLKRHTRARVGIEIDAINNATIKFNEPVLKPIVTVTKSGLFKPLKQFQTVEHCRSQ